MIGICTDSNSQLPGSLADRFGVEVVPITVTVDEHEYLEGVDLDTDRFYEMLGAEPRPRVKTSQPSPGQFAAAYESLLHRGCDEIISIHVTAATSGTLNAARLATRALPMPVRLVDSGTAGFGVSCCVWAAAEAIAGGASLEDAVQIAESLAPGIGAVFVVGQPNFVRTGIADDAQAGVPIMAMHDGQIRVVSNVTSAADAVKTMAAAAVGWGPHLKVAVGLADRSGEQLSNALEEVLADSANVVELVRYRIGPSVGAYAGLGTFGCFMFPAA
jgi:DegV family protein with EDD domain